MDEKSFEIAGKETYKKIISDLIDNDISFEYQSYSKMIIVNGVNQVMKAELIFKKYENENFKIVDYS